jgi:hypothetical protein
MGKVAATEVKAPDTYQKHLKYTIFLAGAIDRGSAEDWQKKVARALDDLDILVLNPRRDDWDASWEQCATCEPFRSQVLWEIEAQEDSDMNIFVFTKDSKAPITFFELGAFGTRKDAMICAEEGFYRQANLDIYAEHFDIPIYHNIDELIADLHVVLEEKA